MEEKQKRISVTGVTEEERFWARVDKSGDCWLWLGGVNNKGYGFFNGGKGYPKTRLAHRVAWSLTHGEELSPSVVIMHKCDNPTCVNPEHLIKGTHLDNSTDKIEKGRANQGKRERLTAESVFEIKTRYEAGGITQVQLAKEYGISHRQMQYIINGHVWKSVNVPHRKKGIWGRELPSDTLQGKTQ